jgi:polysaccharide biosynthesis transport protein
MPPSDLSIDILTSGPITADPVKLLNPLKLKKIIQTFQSKYDLILVDCPPAVGLVDVIQVGMGCDGVALVARLDKVTRSDLAEGIEALNRFNVIGIIANSVNISDRPYRRSSYVRSS